MGCGSSAEAADTNNNAAQKQQPRNTSNTNNTNNTGPAAKPAQNDVREDRKRSIKPSGRSRVPESQSGDGKKERNDAILQSDPDIQEIDVPPSLPGYPAARPPRDRKADILDMRQMKEVDRRAAETPPEKANSYEELMAHLTQGLKSDLEKLRAIFVWMGSQDIRQGNFADASDPETPRGFMRLLNEQKASYSSFFALLCRAADLPCVIVPGYGKSVAYKVGDGEERVKQLRNSWNAVYVAGGWRLVFPLWAFGGVVGHSSGAYTKVEAKGKAVREKEEKSEGTFVKALNEYYFLTDPEEFIYFAFPEASRWQLLTRPWKIDKFVDVPKIGSKYYFEENLTITSKFASRLRSKEGLVEVQVKVEDPTNFQLDYELYYDHEETGKEISSSLQLKNYVFLNRTNSTWSFGIRFPELGTYKLEIDGGRHGFETLMCSFRIQCDAVLEDCQPFPVNPGKIGYGPNLETKLAGIEATSHKDGLVKLSAHREVYFNFQLTRKIQVKAQLTHGSIPSADLEHCVKQSQHNRTVNVAVRVPEEGEYALQLYSQQNASDEYQNTCNYLLRTNEMYKRRRLRTWENPIEKNVRHNVKALSQTKGTRDVEELEKAIQRFEKLDMDDKGDLGPAHDALELKKAKKELRDAISRRHLQTLDKAIERGKASRFSQDLQPTITEAEDVRDHLRQLNQFAHDILEMKQPTISELRSYKKPPGVVYDVMFATFLLLGERKDYIEEWEDLQVLMGRTGKESLIRRVKQFDTIRVKPETVTSVQWQLAKHDEQSARVASAGAGTFYVWMQKVVGAIEQSGGQKDRQPEQMNSEPERKNI